MRARLSSMDQDDDDEAQGDTLLDVDLSDALEHPVPAEGRGAGSSVAVKVLLICVCSVLITSTGLCTRFAEVDGEILYSGLSVTLFSETLKLLLACAITAFSPPTKERADARSVLAFLPGAFGYFVVNNMRYFMIAVVNPGILAIVWNLKIVAIGLFYFAPPFRRVFTARQWLGAVLLVAGSTLAEVSQWGTKNADGQSNTGGETGILVVAAALVVTRAGKG